MEALKECEFKRMKRVYRELNSKDVSASRSLYTAMASRTETRLIVGWRTVRTNRPPIAQVEELVSYLVRCRGGPPFQGAWLSAL